MVNINALITNLATQNPVAPMISGWHTLVLLVVGSVLRNKWSFQGQTVIPQVPFSPYLDLNHLGL